MAVFCFLVIPARFERATVCLEGRCSIQLSYGTEGAKIGRFLGKRPVLKRLSTDEYVISLPISAMRMKKLPQQPALRLLIALSLMPLASAVGQNGPTWSDDIACLVYSHCSSCHRTGGIAPFTLESYQDAQSNGLAMKLAVQSNSMPPWPAASNQGHLGFRKNLTWDEKALLMQWVDQAMPRGDSSSEPPAPSFASNFQIPNPDLVAEFDPYTVPASLATDIYRCFIVNNPLNGTNYLNEIEVIPGNGDAVHHVLLFWDNSGIPAQKDSADPGPGYTSFGGIGSNSAVLVGGWVPGQDKWVAPPGMGFWVPQGGVFVAQIHYPTDAAGKTDSTKVRLKFSPNLTRPYFMSPILDHGGTMTNGPLIIPANQTKTFHSQYTVGQDATIASILPHAHLLCTSMRALAIKPNGDTIPLIDIPQWDFHWQMNYRFKNLIKIPAGTVLHGWATYDNTAFNPNNPNSPPQMVTLGEGTTDEMMLFYFGYTAYQPGDETTVIDPSGHATHLGNCSMSHLSLAEDAHPQSWHPSPNPAHDMWYVHPPVDALFLRITDSMGRTVYAGDPVPSIDVRAWTSGLYIAQMQTKRGTFVVKWRVH